MNITNKFKFDFSTSQKRQRERKGFIFYITFASLFFCLKVVLKIDVNESFF